MMFPATGIPTPGTTQVLADVAVQLTVGTLRVVAAEAVAVSVAASAVTFSVHDLVVFGVLLGCTAAAVELTRKAGEQGGIMTDVQGVWELPVAILLPPLYALIAPVARIALMQWRVRRAPLYRRVFSSASIGLSYGAASVTFTLWCASYFSLRPRRMEIVSSTLGSST